jgi:hypothetical protein
MTRPLLLAALILALVAVSTAQGGPEGHQSGSGMIGAPGGNPFLGGGYLPPVTANAYGPGISADGTGRPFQWQPQGGPSMPFPDPTIQPRLNTFGPGAHSDQYGRSIRPVCPPGMVMC